MRTTPWGIWSALALLIAGCAADEVAPPEQVGVMIRAGEEGVEIRELVSALNPPLARHVQANTFLEYRLVDGSGGTVVSGRIPDFRWAHAEWIDADTGQMRRRDIRRPSGVGYLRLPMVEGELVILEPREGGAVELGRTRFDPTSAVGRTSLALERSDILGDVVLIGGAGAPKDKAIDILLLPEAYKEDQLPAFEAKAAELAMTLFQQPDFAAYQANINLWRLNVKSKEDKLDTGFFSRADTAFDAEIDDDKMISYGDEDDARDLGKEKGMDQVVMIANVDGARASAPGVGFVSMGRDDDGHTFAHELGHSILDLGDEYEEFDGGFEGFRCDTQSFFDMHDRANVQSDVEKLPWSDLLTAGVALPTDEGVADDPVGAFEGANRCTNNWYRPQKTCLMRGEFLNQAFCKVCRRELDRLMTGLGASPDQGGQGSIGTNECPEEWRGDGICDACLGDDPDCVQVCFPDDACSGQEDCGNCPEDCGECASICGDGVCQGDETDASCADDCGCRADPGSLCNDGAAPAPFGCYCDAACADSGDCCADAGVCST